VISQCSPHDTDSVTGEPYPLCDCGNQKYYSNTPPTRADGQSIDCEVNKFDDMMDALACSRRDFEQVVAMDEGMELFTRAWCVAELHRAHALGLPQSMLLKSDKTMQYSVAWLRGLKVENMEASNPADKQMILDRIDDKDAFNAQVQRLIFSEGGLLDTWCGGLDFAGALGILAQRGLERAAAHAVHEQEDDVETGSSRSTDSWTSSDDMDSLPAVSPFRL